MSEHKKFYIPSLDGIRALAAFIVFLSHAGLGSVVPGGLGVTIFFFLSGYLITTLLREEYVSTQKLHLKNFYMRRAFRILPPMYLMLFFVTLLNVLGFVEGSATLIGLAAQIFQFTNYFIILGHASSLPPATSIFWSLAVEEHFYLVLPLVLLVFLRRRRSFGNIAFLLSVFCLGVVCWRIVLVHVFEAEPQRTYLATDTRLDSLLFGCILALWCNPVLDPVPRIFASLSGRLIALSSAIIILSFTLFYRAPSFRETFRYSLQGIAFLPIFWLAIRYSRWPIFRPLNWPLMRGMGQISYSFYLSHVFWLEVTKSWSSAGGLITGVCAFAATIAFATAMYFYVEKPAGRLRARYQARAAVTGLEKGGAASV
jgi:peptidoglycan/LPS O-acetylase OafA/YrhL